MVNRIEAYIDKIEDMGGLVQAVESGWLHREISKYNNKYQKKIESGEMPITGVNYMRDEENRTHNIEVFEYPETYTRQKVKMERLKKERNPGKVNKCLDVLRDKCHTDENLYQQLS